MNPVSLVWFWRGLKGHSVTFAALFASVVCGASIAGGVRELLGALGVHWLYVLLLPGLLFGWLAKRETRWIPEERKRRLIARSLLLGSIGVALLFSMLRPARPAPASPSQPAFHPGDLPRR